MRPAKSKNCMTEILTRANSIFINRMQRFCFFPEPLQQFYMMQLGFSEFFRKAILHPPPFNTASEPIEKLSKFIMEGRATNCVVLSNKRHLLGQNFEYKIMQHWRRRQHTGDRTAQEKTRFQRDHPVQWHHHRAVDNKRRGSPLLTSDQQKKTDLGSLISVKTESTKKRSFYTWGRETSKPKSFCCFS